MIKIILDKISQLFTGLDFDLYMAEREDCKSLDLIEKKIASLRSQ